MLKKRMSMGMEYAFLDVRDFIEQPKIMALEGLNIPLTNLVKENDKIDKQKDVVVYCQSGYRSIEAIALLRTCGFKNLINLKGGVNSWLAKEETLKMN